MLKLKIIYWLNDNLHFISVMPCENKGRLHVHLNAGSQIDAYVIDIIVFGVFS